MAKFYGMIGFETEAEDPAGSGIWKMQIVERPYCGDLLENIGRHESDAKINNDFTINNRVSILADPYALHALRDMRYVIWMNTKWKISSADVQFPRIILSIGGVYNG